MTIKGDLQVNFKDGKKTKYLHDVMKIQYGADMEGAFMIITYYKHLSIDTALYYLEDLEGVSSKYGEQTYYKNYNL